MYEIEILGLENGDSEILVLEETSLVTSEESVAEEGITSEESVAEESQTSEAYMSVFPSGYENLPKDATLMEKLAYGGKVTLIGMVSVFLVLCIIWALCALMGKIFGSVGNNKPKEENASKEQPSASNDETFVSTQAAVSSVDYSMVEVVATAAIAAYRGTDKVDFTVSSIRPCENGAVALAPEVVAQIAASIAFLEGKDQVDFTISSIRII